MASPSEPIRGVRDYRDRFFVCGGEQSGWRPVVDPHVRGYHASASNAKLQARELQICGRRVPPAAGLASVARGLLQGDDEHVDASARRDVTAVIVVVVVVLPVMTLVVHFVSCRDPRCCCLFLFVRWHEAEGAEIGVPIIKTT